MKTLFIVTGAPGVGKSTYGNLLAKQHKALFLDIDTVTEPVVKAGLALAKRREDDRDSDEFKRYFRDPIYQCLWQTVGENIGHLDVVVAAPFTLELKQQNWPEILKQEFNCEVEVRLLVCTPATLKQRMTQRANPRDMNKLANWQNFLAYIDQAHRPSFVHQLIQTD